MAGTHFRQQQQSEARGPRYSLCLLFEGADPLILSTIRTSPYPMMTLGGACCC